MVPDYILNMIAFFICMTAAAILGYFIKEDDSTYAFPFAMIMAFISIFIFVPKEYPLNQYKQTQVYSINRSASTISGGFWLGTGNIKTERFYIGEIQKEGGYVQYLIPAKGTIKIEKDIDHAIFKEQQCERKSVFMKRYLKSKSVPVPCTEHKAKRFLYVPKGTIIKQFKL